MLGLFLILLIVILFFGAGRLGDIGRGLGQGIANFREGIKGEKPSNSDKKP